MSALAPVFARLHARIAKLAAGLGVSMDTAALGLESRHGELALGPAGERISPNGACRLVRAADGWIAVNLAREEDRTLTAAWLEGTFGEEPWSQVERLAPPRSCADLVARGAELGLPVAAVGETATAGTRQLRIGPQTPFRPRPLQVADLSALWAGPACGAVFAALGAQVLKVEDRRRPDPTRETTPALWRRLNGGKTETTLDFGQPADRARLRDIVRAADVVISSARPRALAALGLAPETTLAERPGQVWVAVTGHGWEGVAGLRTAFGDDAAAAGGLVQWTAAGEPRFLGDALADPLTGLAAAATALEAVRDGGGRLVDAALAGSAAAAAAELGLVEAA